MEESFLKHKDEPWRILEFYSGIGGMRYSLMKAGVRAEVVEAFDINDTANDVYEHNFGHRPYQGNIQSLTSFDLDNYRADAWLLSPPCQPYTRQGLQKHSGDARAFSFLRILELIQEAKRPPSLLFVENVVGFETSDTRAKMIEILVNSGFITQEFMLSPLQFGVPYSRPRYFCLAKRNPLSFQHQVLNNRLVWSPIPLLERNANNLLDQLDEPPESSDKLLDSCESIERFLEFKGLSDLAMELNCIYLAKRNPLSFQHQVLNNRLVWSPIPLLERNANNLLDQLDEPPESSDKLLDSCEPIERFLEFKGLSDLVDDEDGATTGTSAVDFGALEHCSGSGSMVDQYFVPVSLINRWGSAMDIVYPDSKRCCCFTKSYYRYVKGTGSLLATIQPLEKGKTCPLQEQGLRYFTPREVANMHSFPMEFQFPEHITLKQRYALLGNSLSVAVVGPLLSYLFREPS